MEYCLSLSVRMVGCSGICSMLFLLTLFLAKVNHIEMPKFNEGGKHSNQNHQNHGLGKSPNDYLRDNLAKSLKGTKNSFDQVNPFLVT